MLLGPWLRCSLVLGNIAVDRTKGKKFFFAKKNQKTLTYLEHYPTGWAHPSESPSVRFFVGPMVDHASLIHPYFGKV
jgi:hypothetical protein